MNLTCQRSLGICLQGETLGLSALHQSAYHSRSLLSLLCFEQKFQNKARSAQWPRRKTRTQPPEASVQW